MRILATLFAKRLPAAAIERRASSRSRTRLRPGKLLRSDLAFLGDCAILDRSARGLRVRLFGDTLEGDSAIAVFDENDGSIREGRVAWRSGREAGIRFETGSSPIEPAVLRRLAGPYYAVRD